MWWCNDGVHDNKNGNGNIVQMEQYISVPISWNGRSGKFPSDPLTYHLHPVELNILAKWKVRQVCLAERS